MRILANYGYKNNGDSYSVTFETLGDVPKDHADSAVDELFELAKRAIQRQISPPAPDNDLSRDHEEIFTPEDNGNGSGSNSSRRNGKPTLKDPTAPATKKQKNLIINLAKQKGRFIDNLNELTMQDASQTIEELMAC